MEILVSDVRKFFPLNGVSDESVGVHLESAILKFKDKILSDAVRKEAVCYQTIANCAPLLFARGMNNLENLETIYTTFGDIESFRDFWENKASEILNSENETLGGKSLFYAAV